jgi:hypothetical protein
MRDEEREEDEALDFDFAVADFEGVECDEDMFAGLGLRPWVVSLWLRRALRPTLVVRILGTRLEMVGQGGEDTRSVRGSLPAACMD